jgi:hypothetical protein
MSAHGDICKDQRSALLIPRPLVAHRCFDCQQIYPPEYEGHFSSLMISRSEISDRVKSLAASIHADYGSERPVMVCVLKGANPVSTNDHRMSC